LGDKKGDVAGFQRQFEHVFKQLYGLKKCNLGAYFDDIQIQQVPKYAYGEEIAVLVEETRDRLSLTRSFQRFSRKLTSAQLPWTASTASDEEERQEAEDLSIVYGQIRDNAGTAYIQRIEGPVAKLRRRAAAIERGVFAGGFLVTVASVFTSVLTIKLSYLIGFLALGTALISAVGGFLASRTASIQMAVADVDREIDAFTRKRAPYDREDALEKLKDRIEPLLAPIEARGLRKSGGRVFISYRRGDADSIYAARLGDAIGRIVGADRLFLDVDGISLGADYRSYITKSVESADIMIVVIGPNWLKSNRLERPDDFVRQPWI
jgi:hypothetical protein